MPQAVYRVDGETGEPSVVADDILGPNGLCFSPDRSTLYIVERGEPNRKILARRRRWRRQDNLQQGVHEGRTGGTPDGMRCDIDGNLWCGWGMGAPELDGVLVVAPDGEHRGFIRLRKAAPASASVDRNGTGCSWPPASLYSVYVNTQGRGGRMTVNIRFATAEDQATCIDFIGTLNGGPVLDDWHVTFAALVTRERGAVYVAEDDELGLLGVATVSYNLAVRYGGEYCQLEELYDPARGRNCRPAAASGDR